LPESNQTEKPTQRRIKKARDKGNFPVSKHLLGGLQFLLAVILISTFFSRWVSSIASLMLAMFRRAAAGELNASELIYLARECLIRGVGGLAVAGLAIVAVVILSQLLITSFGLSVSKLAPDFNKLNPVSKIKNMLSANLVTFGQAMVLIPFFLYLTFRISWQNLDVYLSFPHISITSGAVAAGSLIESLLWKAAASFVVLGLVDLAWERQRFIRGLRMSKQEIKEETKETEGNLEMKGRIKRLMRARGRQRMLQDVKTATAVIVNPTHYAVAILYEAESRRAPLVVAKGKNGLALRIRAMASDCNIPIVENPPLARGLYESVKVGQEIPVQLYRAVAEVLAHIYKLMDSYRQRPTHIGL
jgi:flagellar biosynthesis protein FlhB